MCSWTTYCVVDARASVCWVFLVTAVVGRQAARLGGSSRLHCRNANRRYAKRTCATPCWSANIEAVPTSRVGRDAKLHCGIPCAFSRKASGAVLSKESPIAILAGHRLVG